MYLEIIITAAILGVTVVASVSIWRASVYLSEQNCARIQQEGITFRAREKLATVEKTSGREEWYVPILATLAQNPEIQKLLIEKFAPMMAPHNGS